ncbi:metallo-hydrolase [Alicyclobacillus cellulosilyticus]|uniref:Metallo-hydrolase n=1 Tax=Alicyclobacillus cellulosilyticus TaxID=1003997 RepID=A0A917NEH6_9BACL|nr:MBL fold metallo-hydrolase [Alicyclobacillus cellulosilyticus]GGI95250.1 metallo-hydrolase [Alicyclobacillus cellulosilyticus]
MEPCLEFTVLASGSSGNALYVQSGATRILIDAGLSGRELQRRLREVTGRGLDELDAVVLTHEHVDHVRGLNQILKWTSVPVYATAGTWHQMAAVAAEWAASGRIRCVRAGEAWTLGAMTLTPFGVSHDAEEPVMYRIDAGGASLALVTDLGYVSDRVKDAVRGCGVYIFETNHDPEMLRSGRYPWRVKRRILGDKGHLSNEDAAVALAELVPSAQGRVQVFLAHLSEENNLPELAELTVRTVLADILGSEAERVDMHLTSRHAPSPLYPVLAPAQSRERQTSPATAYLPPPGITL